MEVNIAKLNVNNIFDKINNNEELKDLYIQYVQEKSKTDSKLSKAGREILSTYLNSHSDTYIIKNINDTVKVESVSVSPTSKELVLGEEFKITVTVMPEGADNKNCTVQATGSVEVKNGTTIVGKTVGKGEVTVISAEDPTIQAKVSVVVKDPIVNVESVKITNAESIKSISKGKTVKATTTIMPTGATNKTVTWKSSNPTIASVDTVGNIKGLTKGKTIISAESNNGIKAIQQIDVVVSLGEITSESVIELTVGDKHKLAYSLVPSDAEPTKITFTSHEPTIASVSTSGEVSALKSGKANIVITDSISKISTKLPISVNVKDVDGGWNFE